MPCDWRLIHLIDEPSHTVFPERNTHLDGFRLAMKYFADTFGFENLPVAVLSIVKMGDQKVRHIFRKGYQLP